MDQIHKTAGSDEHESHPILSPAARPAGHLVEFGSGEGGKVTAVEEIRIHQHDGSGREIHARGNGRGGEDGPQPPLLHKRFHQELPGGELPSVVGRYACCPQWVKLPVALQEREPFQKGFHLLRCEAALLLHRAAKGERCVAF